MKYLVRQKVFSFSDSFIIKNEFDEDCYKVKGRVFTIGNKLQLLDMLDQELYFIEQKLFRFMPEYIIYQNGTPIANIKKNLTFFKPSFDIKSTYGDYSIQGNMFAYDFEVLKEGRLAASISKKWFSFGDTYGVSITDGEDPAFTLALVIIIDMIFHNNKNN